MNNVKDTIGWADWTVNPVTGKCPNNCWYCYSNRMYDRFKWNPEIQYHPERLDEIAKLKKPSRIFVGSTHDLFGDWIPKEWITEIIERLKPFRQHTFLFLTKKGRRYNEFIFCKNMLQGVTVTGEIGGENGIHNAYVPPKNSFVSFEPLLGDIPELFFPSLTSWVIIGAMTGHGKQYQPQQEWIVDLVKRAEVRGIPIYMKSNLAEVWKPYKLIQEFPKGVPT